MLLAVYEDIIHDAELILIDTLRNYVKACQEAIQEWEKDIDGTIAQWKTHLPRLKKITPEKVDKLAATFAEKLSSDRAFTPASKSLQAKITRRE